MKTLRIPKTTRGQNKCSACGRKAKKGEYTGRWGRNIITGQSWCPSCFQLHMHTGGEW